MQEKGGGVSPAPDSRGDEASSTDAGSFSRPLCRYLSQRGKVWGCGGAVYEDFI